MKRRVNGRQDDKGGTYPATWQCGSMVQYDSSDILERGRRWTYVKSAVSVWVLCQHDSQQASEGVAERECVSVCGGRTRNVRASERAREVEGAEEEGGGRRGREDALGLEKNTPTPLFQQNTLAKALIV